MAAPKLVFRPAEPADVAALVSLYDRHYRGGYSACFDRYGPATPQNFWWVQSEKSVTVVELNRHPVGLVILGRSGKRLLAEEVLLDAVPEGGDPPLRQLHDWLTARFQQERQDVLTMRCAEINAAVLAIARSFGFTFGNALLVATSGAPGGSGAAGTGGAAGAGSAPEGYHIRRAVQTDGKHIARLHEETTGHALRSSDLNALWRQPDVRVMLAEREKFPVGLLIAQVRDGAGRWTIGVREGHRGRGIGRTLAHAAHQFFQAKRVPSVTTYWGTDVAAARFIRALGARTERTYLYFERAL